MQAREALGEPFKHVEALSTPERKLKQIEEQMRGARSPGDASPIGAASTHDVSPAGSLPADPGRGRRWRHARAATRA